MVALKLEAAQSIGAKTDLTGAKGDLTGSTVAERRSKVVNSVLGSIDSVRHEIDDCLADMTVFHKFEPDGVMTAVSAHASRLTEIAVQIGRIEVTHREWKSVREECDRVLAELTRQYTIASRLQAIREMDYRVSGGQV